MPFELKLTGDLLVMRFFGLITQQDLRLSNEEVEAIEAACDVVPDRITDLSESETDNMTFAVIEELAARRRAAVLKNRIRSAIYAPGEVQFGYSRMFQTLNDNPRIDVAVFRDLTAAVVWVRKRT